MKKYNPAIDQYISNAAAFAIPILKHLRQLIHETCPGVEEAIKWGIPHFDYKGDMMCILAAYKQHCSFSLFKAALMTDPAIKESIKAGKKMGYMDKIKSIDDLPPKKVITALLKEAMALNENGIKVQKPVKEKPATIEAPDYFLARLEKNKPAKKVFETKPPSFRKEYLKWIIEAKTDETRNKRMDQALEWIAEGKGRFWQYNK